MHNLYLRLGWGKFTNQDNLYFVDFANFTRHNLPVGWNDEVGGVFQLLDRRWYNSSSQYLRGHVTYEAPFLLACSKRGAARYCSARCTARSRRPRCREKRVVSVRADELGLASLRQARDLWSGEVIPAVENTLSISLPSHGSVLLFLKK